MSSYIDAINQAANVTTTSKSNESNESVMGKEDFLTLLVAQLQNQDPLNPDEPTEFTAQLAQFSSLEQLFTLNDSMETLATSYENSDRMSTLSTIGKEVAFESNSVDFQGDPVEIGYKLDSQASSVSIQIQNNGATVATLEGTDLIAGNHFVTWDGLTKDGLPAPNGTYTLVVQANSGTDELIMTSPLVKSEVTGVDLSGHNGGTLLTGSGEVPFTSILGVYEPGSKIALDQQEQDEEQESQGESVTASLDTVAEVTEDAAKLTE